MRQKFLRSSFVKVLNPARNLDFTAIVDATYSQLYGGYNISDYAVWIIKDGKVYDRIAWIDVIHLSLLPDQDQAKAETMVEDWNFS